MILTKEQLSELLEKAKMAPEYIVPEGKEYQTLEYRMFLKRETIIELVEELLDLRKKLSLLLQGRRSGKWNASLAKIFKEDKVVRITPEDAQFLRKVSKQVKDK